MSPILISSSLFPTLLSARPHPEWIGHGLCYKRGLRSNSLGQSRPYKYQRGVIIKDVNLTPSTCPSSHLSLSHFFPHRNKTSKADHAYSQTIPSSPIQQHHHLHLIFRKFDRSCLTHEDSSPPLHVLRFIWSRATQGAHCGSEEGGGG